MPKQLRHKVLSLENIEKEQLRGLHSQLWIKCENCFRVTQVMTGKVHDGNKNSKVFDVNSKIVLGAVHAGVGHTALNKILACLNVPQISDTLFKRYEREVGPAIEKAAEESCKKAAQEERHLIIENIDKLCEELPQEIVEEIYPHLNNLRSNNPPEQNLVSDNLDEAAHSKIFDSSIGEIINIVVSYDMGWSKRGNGRSYDSLNGYGCIIGFLSGKILDYGTRNRKYWCKRGAFNGTSSPKVVLKDPELYTHLYNLFGKYANNAHKIAFSASSQANENVNNIMAHKAPKSRCYSMSESSDYRYASAVCSKNDGESYLLEVYKILTLSPGKNTELYASRYDKKRRDRAKKAKLLSAKVRRNLLAENREKLRKKNEKTEGLQYESNCGLSNDNNINEVVDANIASICQDNFLITLDNCDIVYFDLETSGFGKFNEILQIAAMYEEHEFSIYINPTKEISSEASLHTGLRNISGQLYLRDKKVETVPLKDALSSFLKFLDLSPKPCVLVAHNSSFDSSFFIRAVVQCNMILEFKKIAGFSDSLSLFKKRLASRKGPGQFKLGTLAKDFLKIESTDNFHEALYDVKILKQLALSVLNIEEIYNNTKSWASLLTHTREEEKSKIMLLQLKPLKTVLTPGILKKMAIAKMT
ncbi:uncharacterized protein LOC123302280 [Chrysoperla carnea]|uniref:uncharacterized protein LOC123302280 n=1 Tax=Chrysoperla carnea TaxID=189513 RepID=UPI001D06635C|nr:uncharacterized protein LOC123302280 [Chrysoperla carnea]